MHNCQILLQNYSFPVRITKYCLKKIELSYNHVYLPFSISSDYVTMECNCAEALKFEHQRAAGG